MYMYWVRIKPGHSKFKPTIYKPNCEPYPPYPILSGIECTIWHHFVYRTNLNSSTHSFTGHRPKKMLRYWCPFGHLNPWRRCITTHHDSPFFIAILMSQTYPNMLSFWDLQQIRDPICSHCESVPCPASVVLSRWLLCSLQLRRPCHEVMLRRCLRLHMPLLPRCVQVA